MPVVAEAIKSVDADQSAAIARQVLEKLFGGGGDLELASERWPAASGCSIGRKHQHARQHVATFGGGFEQSGFAGATWPGDFDDARGRLGLGEQVF